MSILTQLLEKKITFSEAVTQAGAWFEDILARAPASVQQDAAAGLADLKQAASNAVALADTSLAAILTGGGQAVEAAALKTLSAVIGAGATAALSPGLDAAIDQAVAALKAEIDAVAAQVRARLVVAPQVVQPPPNGG